jgi:DNA-binding response OmpR family regulator
MVERCLVGSGFEVKTVSRSKGIVKIVREQRIDLVVPDPILIDKDGLAL